MNDTGGILLLIVGIPAVGLAWGVIAEVLAWLGDTYLDRRSGDDRPIL